MSFLSVLHEINPRQIHLHANGLAWTMMRLRSRNWNILSLHIKVKEKIYSLASEWTSSHVTAVDPVSCQYHLHSQGRITSRQSLRCSTFRFAIMILPGILSMFILAYIELNITGINCYITKVWWLLKKTDCVIFFCSSYKKR